MKTIEKSIINYISKIKGSVIGFGITNPKIILSLEKNNDIKRCDLLNSPSNSSDKNGKNKKSYIKNLRKKYKKKKNEYMIMDLEEMLPHKKTLVKDSIYINSEIIYLYTTKNNYQKILNMYERYSITYNLEECKDGFVIAISTKKAKNNYIKDIFYYILDVLSDIYNIIGDILIS